MPATPAASLITTAQDSPGVEADDWHAWRNQGSYEARSRLIERHMPFAKMLAAKLYGNRIILEAEFDDYRQWGIEGLIAAVDHFDPDRNVPFEAYSAKRIQGAILNEADTLSDRAAQISMRARIRRERASSVGESADTRADTSTLFNRLVEVAVGLALGVMLEDTGMIQTLEAVAPQTDVYRSVELAQLHKRVQALVELLPERERMVIKYHYFFGMQFELVARELQLTRGRISQIHRQALRRMQEMQQHTSSLNLQI